MGYIVTMEKQLQTFVQAMRREMRIKYRVQVGLFAGDTTPDDYDASHRFNRRTHKIELAANPSRGLLTALAHELCHARVNEIHGFRVAYHGEEFQAMTKKAVDAAARLGYILDTENIFIEGIDE